MTIRAMDQCSLPSAFSAVPRKAPTSKFSRTGTGRKPTTPFCGCSTPIMTDYRKPPVACGGASCFDHLIPSHAQSECDPRLWSQVEDLVRQRLAPEANTAASNLHLQGEDVGNPMLSINRAAPTKAATAT